MSSAIVLIVISFFLRSARATFPPVSNPPPIPAQLDRPWDISEQRIYIQDDTQSNLPQNEIRDAGYFLQSPKVDDQQWYAPEIQPAEKNAFPSSTETFIRYFDNGSPAVGPVATPLPDDTYAAQPSGTAKIANPSDDAGSAIWVLTERASDQYKPERWVQVADDRIADVMQDGSPKIVSDSVKAIPPPPIPVKNPSLPVPNTKVEQIWIRTPSPIQSQKIVQNAPAYVENIPVVKQNVYSPQPTVKQYVQTQIVKEALPLAPPPTIGKKSSNFVVPPPLPPYVGVDNSSPKQIAIVTEQQPVLTEKSGGIIAQNDVLQQVKHVWVPTSEQTGKFITIPVRTVADNRKSIISNGIPMNIPPPVAVSDTWVLKQDGPFPRFEQRKSINGPINGNVLISQPPGIPFDSPKNPSLGDKTAGVSIPNDIWPVRKGFVAPAGNSGIVPQLLAPSLKNSDQVVTGKAISAQPVFPQKTYNPVPKVLQSPTPPILPQVSPVIKGKPCPIGPQKSPFSPKAASLPVYRQLAPIRKQPFARIIRLNRYPYGSYYVLNSRIGAGLYGYPRFQGPTIQRTRNGLIRLTAARPFSVPFPISQVSIPVPKRQLSLPGPVTKSVGPMMQPQFLYPSVQTVNRLRYAYPGGYLRFLPVGGRNMIALPPLKLKKLEVLTSSSSSESSSSESSASENSKPSKKSEEVDTIGSSSSSLSTTESKEPELENKSEKESEEEQETSESAPEEIQTSEEVLSETETQESVETAESHLSSQLVNRPLEEIGKDNYGIIDPSFIRFGNRERHITNLPFRDMSNLARPDFIRYSAQNSIFKGFIDNSGDRTRFVSDDPRAIEQGRREHAIVTSTPDQSVTVESNDSSPSVNN